MKKLNITAALISIGIAELTGVLSALLSGGMSDGYGSFNQPPLSPPAIVFPIVWTILYALMGFAAYLVWDSVRGTVEERTAALRFYAAQLAVNFSWSIIFFRFEAFWLSVAVIILLDALVLITALKFRKINFLAFLLFIPYLLWLALATYLNIGVAILN